MVVDTVNKDLSGPWQDQLKHAENEIKAARDLIRRVAGECQKFCVRAGCIDLSR
jgi:hypothetical protein